MNVLLVLFVFIAFVLSGCAPHRVVYDNKPVRGFTTYIKDYSFVEEHGSIRNAVKFLLKQDMYINLYEYGIARISHSSIDGAGRIGAFVSCNNSRGREYLV